MAPTKGSRQSPRKAKPVKPTTIGKVVKAGNDAKLRQCRICPDRPLKAHCACPKGGRRAKSKAIVEDSPKEIPGSPPSTPPPQRHAAVMALNQPPPPSTPPPASTPPPESSPASTSSSPKKKRITPSAVNAVHGFVNGACRGSKPTEVPRTRAVEPPFVTRKEASRAFRAQTKDLLTRAESVADRSAAWVYIAMQQPGAKKPFVHFASRKIRREAPKELEQVHITVSGMMALLMRGDRAKDLETVREHMETEEKLKKAELAATEAERAAKAIADENAVLKAQIAEQRAQVAARDALLKSRPRKRKARNVD
ncbi:hypothetical protein DFP72DRAFT_1064801 [Ephemerocybe angulata]|uniref:Uncharacterized protein n=1 Tax=Ephemerocybe angulata TaxID=980116 RepID=A0A8H6I6C0_9AGAR|nr:hypothetical protein DFP72DRAFT_1064801 [Tulosesus angulatus]